MPACHTCKVAIERSKPLRCSQCHSTIYCSTECQKADWKVHKRSACTKPAIFRKVDKMMKKMGGPGTPLGFLQEMEAAVWAERARNPKPVDACDGCSRRFHGRPAEDGADDEDGGDAGEPFKRCKACDYTVCEDCTFPENQGIPHFDRPAGTCRCFSSNFGVSYCLSAPRYVDGDGSNRYYGDRHPEVVDSGYANDAFEETPRKCKTCGVVARCLKKEHLKDALPGMD